MGLLDPLALVAGALALPIIGLWILRPRRRRRVIGSTLLWRQVLDNVQASHPWQRLRWHVLLALQLAAIALFAVALARPFRLAASGFSDETFVLLDASASMQATDVKPSRFAAAKLLVQQAADSLPDGARLTIVLMGESPRVLIARSADHRALDDALAAARPTNGGANLAAALTLIAPLVAEVPRSQVLVYSDGGTGDATQLGPLPFPVKWVRVGSSAENLAVTAFAAQPGDSGPVALASVANYGSQPHAGQIDLWVDHALYDVRQFAVEPGASVQETWTRLPSGATMLEARLRGSDGLALDNQAYATVRSRGPLRVLLITAGNPFLQKALELFPGVKLTTVDQPVDAPNAEVIVYDGIAPTRLPLANILFVHPPTGSMPWPIASDRAVGALRTVGASGLDRLVDLSPVHVRQTRAMTLPSDAQTLIADSNGSLVAVDERDRQRIAVVGFDLHQSDLPLTPAFPIIMSNLIDWLSPGSSAGDQSVAPGTLVSVVPWPAATRIVLARPDGSAETLAPPFPARPVVDTEQPGVYRITQSAPGQPDQVSWFVVNLFSPRESNLTLPATLPLRVGESRPSIAASFVPFDLWPWLTAAALAVLVAEWWAYQRTT